MYVIYSVLGVVLGGAIYLVLRRGQVAAADRVRLDVLTETLREKTELLERRDLENTELKTRLAEQQARLEAEREAAKEKNKLLEEAKNALSDAFKALSAEALKSNNESFLALAKENLMKFQEGAQADLTQRTQAVAELVSPLKNSLEGMDKKLAELEAKRVGAYAQLTEQVKHLSEAQGVLQGETANLVRALRAPQVRGRWGEMQLRRTVELAGMVDHVDFIEQASVSTEDGQRRPDMVVSLPNGRSVVIDAKAPLLAYLEALEAEGPEVQAEKLKQHAKQVKNHLTLLSSKAYWKQLGETPEFVVLFLPGEAFFSAALQADPQMLDYGAQNKVILATPTTLIALLKAVAHGWSQEGVAKEAAAVSALGKDLYERMAVLAGHFLDIKRGLDRAVSSYNKAARSMESRVLPSARKFKELYAGSDREIPALETVEEATWEPRADVSEEFTLSQ
ncbi:MAG: hypothetical protein Tsb0018_02650 [Opitutales bacterium]